ncbi:MAG: ABC transporter ATP-binding protein [Bacteroidaceae bacterium]|nr:ABC transporter ATP-binding protein [Bacteroidaceae bacterium]
MIRISKLGFSYGKDVVLKDITMNLEEGRIYGLLGENGVGKTTLLTILSGLKPAMSGTIEVDGTNPFERRPSTLSSLYYLPDEVLPKQCSALAFAQDMGQYWESFDTGKFVEIMKTFDSDINQRMDCMSLGQLKKAYISFALACNARYLFMDEPTNGLDIPSKAQFRKAVTKYTSENTTIVISTHQARDLEAIIDPIIILDRQSVLLNATVEQISEKLYFDYGNTVEPDALYSELIPGGCIQVLPNSSGIESKVNIEALFNAVLGNKETIREMFKK